MEVITGVLQGDQPGRRQRPGIRESDSAHAEVFDFDVVIDTVF